MLAEYSTLPEYIQPEIIYAFGLYGMAFAKKIRRNVYKRQEGKCDNCGDRFPKLETHHRYPVSKQQEHGLTESYINSIENAVGLCSAPPAGNGCHRDADDEAFKGNIYPQVHFEVPKHHKGHNGYYKNGVEDFEEE